MQVDRVRHKRLLLDIVDNLTGVLDKMEEDQTAQKDPQTTDEGEVQEADRRGVLPSFDEVFLVSALLGDGVEEVKVLWCSV